MRMGAKDSKQCCITYDEALKRVSEGELKRLNDAFHRASYHNGIITRQAFIKEVLGEFVPLKLAEHIFQACGGTHKGISFKDLLCGLVLLTRGKKDEKIRFIFNLCANESGSYVVKEEMVKLVQSCDGGFVPEAVADCFIESEKVTFEEFRDWLLIHKDATTLTRWLLSDSSTVSLSNDLETPTFYQTLAGVTHLEETDISELEKRYWILKTQSRTGKFDLETLNPLISPPVPSLLCEGIFNAFDENQDGHIDFKEMACGISACCRGPVTERQKFCFKIFDKDQDGILSKSEVYEMVKALIFVQEENRSVNGMFCTNVDEINEIVNEIMKIHDVNKDDAITLDEYLVWSVDQNLTSDLLNILFQVCHIVFGLKPSSKEEEKEIVRGWIERDERRGMQIGQFWYLISMDWWRSWNEYVDYKDITPYPADSLKRSSKLQRKVDGSVAQAVGDTTNVVLSSITNFNDDNVSSLQASPTPSRHSGSNTSLNSLNSFNSKNSSELSLQHFQGISVSKKSNNLQSSEIVKTPTPSPNLTRKNFNLSPQKPTAIDNSLLIVPNTLKVMILTGEGGKLRNSISHGRDFELVTEAVWRALSQWYGGSPALPRQVILPHNSDVPELEMHPVTLKLYRHQANTIRQVGNTWTGVVGTMSSACGNATTGFINSISLVPKRYLAYLASFSRMATLKQVFDYLCARLRLRLEDTRLWLYRDDGNMAILEEEEYILEQLATQDNEVQLLIEVRNKDQTWPEEMSNLINAKLDQKSQGPTEKGATGLNNLGNTCFMNAALQCVSNTRPLTLYFTLDKHLYELNRSNPLGMKGHIAKRYGDLVHDLWSGSSKTIAPLKLRWTIGKYAPRFNGFQQHDSQELLAFLMDGLHEDLNRVHEKPYVELKDSDGRPDEEVAKEAWENHIIRNRSIIVDLFHGQLQSTVTCKVCGHSSVRFDPFNYLSLPLPMESCVHLEVVVVRLDGSLPVKYGLRLNHDDKYSTLKQQLGNLCEIPPHQLLIAEVSGAVIKSLPPDDHKIRMIMGGCFFAYELAVCSDTFISEDLRQHREPQTLTQIQRIPISGSSITKKPTNIYTNTKQTANGDVPKVNYNLNQNIESTKSIFKVGEPDDGCSNYIGQNDILQYSYQSSQNSWQPMAPFPVIGNSNSSSMSSSLISNSSNIDLMDVMKKNFIIAYHRKMIRQDVYFLSSQKTRPTLFGLPLILPCHEMTTHQDLYQAVWTQVARLVSPLPPSEAAVTNHAQDCDDSLGYEYPFTLKAVQKDGLLCALCPWYSFCRGCRIECCDADFNFSAAYLAIDWDPTALHLRYQASQELVFMDHKSVEQTRRQQTEPINLHDCLEAFTKEEQLGDEEKYYCSKCKQHQLASKKLQIWRLPPILIVHLKRFQLLNGRWVKSHKIVRFPFHHFDPTDYLASEPKRVVMHWRKQRHNKVLSHSNLDVTLITNCNNDMSLMQNKDSGDIFKVPLNQNCNQHSVNVPSQNKLITSPITSRKDVNKLMNGSIVIEHPLSEKFENNNLDLGEKCKDQMNLHNIKAKQIEGFQDYHQHQLQSGYDPLCLQYKLYALACHSGILGGGHYICFACNPNNRWYCYNDSSCKELELDQIDANSAYMLFYEREGLDYESYMPDVSGRIPDTKEIDDEFENDFRKMCCVQ